MIEVRAPLPGEGASIVPLWRELWDLHEAWGSYPGTDDPLVYGALARRIDEESSRRGGFPLLARADLGGAHIHLVALAEGAIAGQVEGWVERSGIDPRTPLTCEIRSLVVAEGARGRGVGRALLRELEDVARTVAPRVFAVAEVLGGNPHRPFYAREGFANVGYVARAPLGDPGPPPRTVRRPRAEDAFAVAALEAVLAERRRRLGDRRFDPPRPVDAAHLGPLARYLTQASGSASPAELVVVDDHDRPVASATFALLPLEAPFLPGQRAVLGRFAVAPGAPAEAALGALLPWAQAAARRAGARWLELTDLSPPGEPLFEAARRLGASPWSVLVGRRGGP